MNKTKKPILKEQGHTSSMQTPPDALLPLLPYLPKTWMIWECACGKGYLVDRFLKEGYKVKWSDIERDPLEDFLHWEPRKGYDCIVTNPPYDVKDKFLKRACDLGKPWAFLLPVESLGGKYRQSLFRTCGLQVIFLDKRINFETPNGGSSAWFPTAWFTHGLNLPFDMLWYEFPATAEI